MNIPHDFFLITPENSMLLLISPRKIHLLFLCSYPQPHIQGPLLLFVSGIVQYRCMRLPKTDDMIEHIKMIQIPYLDIWSILLSEQVPHRLIWIEAIQVTCSGKSLC